MIILISSVLSSSDVEIVSAKTIALDADDVHQVVL